MPAGTSPLVVGIVGMLNDPGYHYFIPLNEVEESDYLKAGRSFHHYSPSVGVTGMTAMAKAIKDHCWPTNSKDSLQLEQSKDYMKPLYVANSENLAAFEPTKDVNSDIELASMAEKNFAIYNPEAILVKARDLKLSFQLTFPNNIKNIYTSGVTINLLPGFSCTATGDKVFEANSVVLGPISSAAALGKYALPVVKNTAANQLSKTAAATGFKIMPNPSATGIFKLTIPVDKQGKKYKIIVTTTDGKAVLQKTVAAGENTDINISGNARGEYILSVYDGNRILYQAKLVY